MKRFGLVLAVGLFLCAGPAHAMPPRNVCRPVTLTAQPERTVTFKEHCRQRRLVIVVVTVHGLDWVLSDPIHSDDVAEYGNGCVVFAAQHHSVMTVRLATVLDHRVRVRIHFLDR